MQFDRFVLGTAQAKPGYGVTSETIQQATEFFLILEEARRLGINWIDTAQNYGIAESWIGDYRKDPFQVASKISIRGSEAATLRASIEKSSSQIGDNQLRAVFAHDWEVSRPVEKANFLKLQRDYEHLRFGVSIYETSTLLDIFRDECVLSMVQIPLSVLNQSFLPLLSECRDRGIEVWARSIFLQGAVDYSSSKNPFRSHPDLLKLRKFCEENSCTPFLVAISFVLSSAVDKIVLGFENSSQLTEISKYFDYPRQFIDFSELASTNLDFIDPRRWK